MKLFFPLSNHRRIGAYRPALARLGVSITLNSAEADAVLPLGDSAALPLAGHPKFMSQAALDVVLNKDRLGETGLTVLPTTLVESEQAAPAGSIVKPRNSAAGGLVAQPHLGFPQQDIDITVAVSPLGEIKVFNAMRLTHHAAKDPGAARSATEAEVALVSAGLQDAFTLLDIKGGIHNLQFLFHQGQWCLVDWNPRPANAATEGLPLFYPYMDAPLAHMMGLQEPAVQPAVFVYREYRNPPIPKRHEAAIRAAGLLPRGNGVNGFSRVSGVGASEAEVNALFDTMEAQCGI